MANQHERNAARDYQVRIRGQMDQLATFAGEYAAVLWSFYDHLRSEGFNDHQAMCLTRDWLGALVHPLHWPGQAPDNDPEDDGEDYR